MMRFFCFLLSISVLSHASQIVLFYGSCSSGKTTLARSVIQRDASWQMIEEDDLFIESWLQLIAEKFPDEFLILTNVIAFCNLFHALNKNIVIFQEGVSQERQDAARQIVERILATLQSEEQIFLPFLYQRFENLIIRNMQDALDQDKNILLIRWHLSPERIQKSFPDIPINKVLIFSSLPSALGNLLKRNKEASVSGNYYNQRFYKNLIRGHIKLYQLSDRPECSIFSCDKTSIRYVFDAVRSCLQEDQTSTISGSFLQEVTEEELMCFEKQFISSHLTDRVFVQPKEQYHLILYADLLPLEENVSHFMKYVTHVSER